MCLEWARKLPRKTVTYESAKCVPCNTRKCTHNGFVSDLLKWVLKCRFYATGPRPFPLDSGPLSPYKCGPFLTWENFTGETRLIIKKGLNSTEFAGHSFQIWAATAAASAGLPPWFIKVLGRWSPDCFERYKKPDLLFWHRSPASG